MTLLAIVTGMNVAEICGLQWKHANLSPHEQGVSGEWIAPRHHIAVRKQWYRGELEQREDLAAPEPSRFPTS